jgi:hypothetical protein
MPFNTTLKQSNVIPRIIVSTLIEPSAITIYKDIFNVSKIAITASILNRTLLKHIEEKV